MAISQRDSPPDHKTPLLQSDVEAAVLDFRHSPSGSGGWRSAAFIIGKASYDVDAIKISVSVLGFDFGFVSGFRCWMYGEVRILRREFEPGDVSERAVGAVDGDGGGECEHVVRHGVATSVAWSSRR